MLKTGQNSKNSLGTFSLATYLQWTTAALDTQMSSTIASYHKIKIYRDGCSVDMKSYSTIQQDTATISKSKSTVSDFAN